MEWLKDQDYIYFNFSSLRWAWDIDKIVNVEISDDVVALLIREMQRLPTDMQLGLKVGLVWDPAQNTLALMLYQQVLG